MKIFSVFALSALIALPAIASAQAPARTANLAIAGKTLYFADGKRVGAVYRVLPDGSPQIIFRGKMITVPASTLTSGDGRVMTNLTKKQLASFR